MKHFFTTFFITLFIGFGANAQNYHYAGTTKPAWGNGYREITINVDIELVSLYYNGFHYGINYNYDIRFFENGSRLPSNFTMPIYNLRMKIVCGDASTEHGIIDDVNSQGYRGTGSTNTHQYTSNAPNATLESLECDAILFSIGVPGLSESIKLSVISPLPIELITFDAYKKDRQVELSWKTASETNNDFFTIDRSVDGISWESIQTIDGAGNTANISEYSWTDVSPYAGVSYYRLKQTDFDGRTETFNIVSVEQKEVIGLQAYPNPVSHTSTILGINENEAVRVFNTVGVEVTESINISASPSKKTFLDMSQLPKGMYYVINGDESIRLLKE